MILKSPVPLRLCKRCGHRECPFCHDWCDVCTGYDDDGREIGNLNPCSGELACVYDEERSPLFDGWLNVLSEKYKGELGAIRGSFGQSEDGFCTFAPEVQGS